MFSDTHFHFRHMVRDRGLDGKTLLEALAARDTFFGLDIGTEADDLSERQELFNKAANGLPDSSAEKIRRMIYFAAGIWPSPDEIMNRTERIKILEHEIAEAKSRDGIDKKICAVGECGLDHHWNPSGVDGRSSEDFDSAMFNGERELFEMQLELAKSMNLPVIIHSRDAFDGTVDCIRNVGWHNGIIHCYSYGKAEARVFLDLGWHIAFGGGITYTKKSKMDDMIELLRYVPKDRFLMETDAPYLAPVPFRGTVNTPILIEHCYNFAAQAIGITPADLSHIVDDNIKGLFRLS